MEIPMDFNAAMPYLYFNENYYFQFPILPYNSRRFPEFIDNVMSTRSNASILTFRICSYYSCHNDVVNWIDCTVRHNVVVVDITVALNLVLPPSLLDCKSLESLSICLNGKNWILSLVPPISVDLPALKTLRLEGLALPGREIGVLISKCPVLETLVLSSCILDQSNVLIVEAPQLKHLEILNLNSCPRTYDDQNVSTYQTVAAFTPNLTYFKCKEKWMMGNYSLLSNSSPTVKTELNFLGSKPFEYNNYWTETFTDHVKKCLAGVSKVKALSLKLPAWLLQDVFVPPKQGPEECDHHIIFHSLTSLKLRTSVVEQQTRARSYILEICPNLQTFVLDLVKDPNIDCANEIELSSIDEECLQREPPLVCVLRSLKFVEIRGSALRLENEYAFVRFLLQNALVLETISFRHREFSERSRVLKFLKKVATVTRASPKVKIMLLGRKLRHL